MPSSNVSYLSLRLCLSSEASSIMPARMSVVEHAIDDAPSIHGCGDVLHRSRNGNCRFVMATVGSEPLSRCPRDMRSTSIAQL